MSYYYAITLIYGAFSLWMLLLIAALLHIRAAIQSVAFALRV